MIKNFKIFAAIFFLIFSVAFPNFVNAKEQINVDVADEQTEISVAEIEKYFKTLPQKNKYKSSQRPLMIQGAMNVEIENLVKSLKNPVAYRFSNYFYVAGTYKNYPVVIARTEQGMANAAASTVIGIEKFNPVAVINQGTAGGHVADLYLNDIVIGSKSIDSAAYKTEFSPAGAGVDFTAQEMRGVYAYDVTTNFFQPHKEFFADSKLLKVAKKAADSHSEFAVAVGTISSSNIWNSNVDYINFLNKKYGSLCEEMENNAAASICQSASIPFIGIRVISNNVTNGSPWDESTAATCQNFVLLVAENYIADVLKK